eukprot:437577-Alexandrium_andersonii.AAC.1
MLQAPHAGACCPRPRTDPPTIFERRGLARAHRLQLRRWASCRWPRMAPLAALVRPCPAWAPGFQLRK